MMRGVCGVWLCLLGLLVVANGQVVRSLPHTPKGFNLHCDVCETMVHRTVPYCERENENMDFLPDFCTFNYNRVLRTECDYIMDVMEYVWCPSACEQVRLLQAFSAPKICNHPLVNCTERAEVVAPSASPSPSPSLPLPRDCVLCEYVLKHVAIMCMNNEHADARNIYHVCMEETKTREDFEHCERRLHELVKLAGTEDPCTMLSCSEPKVACRQQQWERECHVVEYNGTVAEYSNVGLDTSGNILEPEDTSNSFYSTFTGLGPSDFRPGQNPYHAPSPRIRRPLPPHVRVPGHLWPEPDVPSDPSNPTMVSVDKVRQIAEDKVVQDAEENEAVGKEPVPTPIPLKDIQMQ